MPAPPPPMSLLPGRGCLITALVVAICLCVAGGATASSGGKNWLVIDAPLLTSKLPTNKTFIVSPSGKDDFTSVQKAIDSVPDGNSGWVVVHLRAGVYREKVHVPESKPYIFLRGNGKGKTWIVWNDSATVNSESATFTVLANNFIAFGISFKNDAPNGPLEEPRNQTVAAKVSGDKVAFYHCAFYSPHNTLFDHRGRHYYESSYIQGAIDFIFGRGQSLFQSCEIFVVEDKRTKIHGSITAQNRDSEQDRSGFVFVKGKVYGVGGVYLGRPKSPHSRVVWANTYLSKTIVPEGWTNWRYDGTTNNLLCGEHNCKGPGANHVRRTSWSKQLTEKDVAGIATVDFIDGKEWLPVFHPDNK